MAYALQSLVQILDQILLPRHDQKPQIESLLEKVISLQALLERTSQMSNKHLENLESQIRDAAYRAEDIIESYTAGLCSTLSSDKLKKLIHEFDSVTAAVLNVLGGNRDKEGKQNPVVPPTRLDPSPNDFLVGVDDDLIQLKDRLTGYRKKLEIIPVVGMGGIGKTTLARKVYGDPFVTSHFDVCSWVTISQDYDYRAVLIGLVRGINGHEKNQEMLQNEDNMLVNILYKSLFDRRYFIVLDDMWSCKVWDDIKMCFPDNDNRSRIVLTTRENDVANYVDPSCKFHQLHLLEKIHSWELLRYMVFGQERCPLKLQPIGEKIADNCGGIPLAITVIGGLLSTEKQNQDFWTKVFHDTRSIIRDKHEVSNIFSLSYNYLPLHLKPCFLYFGAFPEDCAIQASILIKLWVAEGFLKPIKDKSLEEVASIYLKSLVDRNLISVHQQMCNTSVKSYGIHDLLRDLCLKKAIEDKFLIVQDSRADNITQDAITLRRKSIYLSVDGGNMDLTDHPIPLTRSFLCFNMIKNVNKLLVTRAFTKDLTNLFFTSRLLRILYLLDVEFERFPEEMLQLINLRYLAIWWRDDHFPRSIATLTNLQTLIARTSSHVDLPSELWEIACLRHVYIAGGYRSNITFVDVGGHVLENLQTLGNVSLYTHKTLESFPNLKSLGIVRDFTHRAPNFTHLEKLESLKYACGFFKFSNGIIVKEIRLPHSLKKLTLDTCSISVKEIMFPNFRMVLASHLASLPNLEILKLRNMKFHMQHWRVGEGGFPKLQFLLLKRVHLWEWTVGDSAFPNLRRLVIVGCQYLREIPSCIGHIPALQMIEVDNSIRAATSAMRILEEQREYDNYDLRVRIKL